MHFSTFVAGSSAEGPLEYEGIPVIFLFELFVEDEKLFFEVFLKGSEMLVDSMGIALFLNSGDLFREEVD